MADLREFIVVAESEAIRARVALNGCTAFSATEPRPRTQSMRLLPWTLRGENLFTVELGHFDPKLLEEEDVEPALRVRLYHPRQGNEAWQGNLILEFRFSDNECAVELDDDLTPVFEHRIHNDHEWGPWCWATARPYRPEDHGAVEQQLERFGKALADRDPETLRAMLALKTAEICQALDMNLDDTEVAQYRFFESYFEHDDWQLGTWKPSEMKLIPEAGGRLVRATAPDGGLPFRGLAGGRPFAFDVVLSCLDDAWVIVR